MAGLITGVRALIFAAFVGIGALSAAAQETPDARALIQKQLDAFAKDDAAEAFGYAAPGIKQLFGSPEIFIAMVQRQYPAVYRHRSAEFGPVKSAGDTVAQAVTLVDADNQVWTALYTLARQPDGAWLISGCTVLKSGDTSL